VVSLAEGGQSSLGSLGLGLPAILSGCALVVGFLTPGAGVLAGVVSLAALLARPAHGAPGLFGEGEAATLLIVMVVAAALVGPGAFSLDARLFVCREPPFVAATTDAAFAKTGSPSGPDAASSHLVRTEEILKSIPVCGLQVVEGLLDVRNPSI
jgi:hypothetical protein